MNNNNTIPLTVVSIIALVALVLGVVNYSHAPTSVSRSSFGAVGGQLIEQYVPYILYNGGYNSALDITTSGTITGATASITSSVTSPNFITQGTVNSTSTAATSVTLTSSDIASFSMLSISPSVASTTLSMPASSTLSTFLSTTVGTRRGFDIANSTTTVAYQNGPVNITLINGTGVFIEPASSTQRIYPNHAAHIDCIRVVSSDIACTLHN